MATASAISSPGIGSGLDVNTIVSKLMTTEQGPLNNVNTQISAVQSKISAYGTLKSALSSFQTAVTALSTTSKFSAQSATVSDNTVFSATANGKATNGDHAVTVSQLAQNQKIALSGFANTSDVVGSGTLTIAFGTYETGNTFTPNAGTTPKSISIPTGNGSLAGIRDAINAADTGVTASIVNDGSTNGNRLVITSKASGTANSIKISVVDDDGNNVDSSGLSQLAYDPTLSSGSGKNLSELQTAKDALLTIDGISVTKSSNVISDAVEGVTLTLQKVSAGSAVNLNVATDSATITASVNSFVKAYNDLNTTIRNLTNYDATTKVGGALLGDATTRSISTQIKSILTKTITSSGTINSLSQIGVAFQRDGTLAVDSTKLQSSIDNNFSELAGLFSATSKSTDSQITFGGNSSKTQMGNYAVTVNQLATQGSLLGNALPNLNIVQGVNDQLNLNIDGAAYSVTLTAANYGSASALAAELQSRIALAGSTATVTVNGGALQISSPNYGASSSVSITGGTAATSLFGASPASTTGTDVAGTLNGVAATGQGQNLVGATGDASEGLILKIAGGALGARGSTSFTTGYAYQLNTFTTDLLSDTGVLTSKTDGFNSSITRLTKQQTEEQDRLTLIEANYRAQFNALDTMISSMQSTGSFLTQQLALITNNSNSKN